MNKTDADNIAKLFGQLYPNATPQQARSFRDALLDPSGPEDVRDASLAQASPGDVEAALRAEVLLTPFAGDALVKVYATIRADAARRRPVRSTVDATREMREGWREAEAKTAAVWQSIDDDLAELSREDLLALRQCVARAAEPAIAGLIGKSDPSRHGLARGEIHRARGQLWEFAERVPAMQE